MNFGAVPFSGSGLERKVTRDVKGGNLRRPLQRLIIAPPCRRMSLNSGYFHSHGEEQLNLRLVISFQNLLDHRMRLSSVDVQLLHLCIICLNADSVECG